MAEYKGIKAVLRQFYVLIKQKLDGIKVDADHFEGTLPISKGGTGGTTTKGAEYNIHNGIPTEDSDFSDASILSGIYQNPSTTLGVFYKRTVLHLWNYIQSKISSVLGLTKTSYGGNAKTAALAEKAQSDVYGNSFTSTYATIKNTRVWNCLYSTSGMSNGYFNLVTIQGTGSGNHDVSVKGTCFIDKCGTVSEVAFSAYVRGSGSVVSSASFATQRIGFSYDYSHLLIATYSAYTHENTPYFNLTIYGKVEQLYQRFNTCIDYASAGDVSDRLSLEKVILGRSLQTTLYGTVISRINLNNLVVLPTSTPSSPVEGQIWIG